MPETNNFPYPLYLVLSEGDCLHHPWLKVAEEAILGGVDIIQLREKNDNIQQFKQKAYALKEITDHYHIPLIINDAIEVADAVDAWGIHVGQQDIPPSQITAKYGSRFQIGWSMEHLDQLHSSELPYVHHLGVSPVFRTPTKTDTITEWGIQGVKQLTTLTDLPLIAIGSINRSNLKAVHTAGACSIAVVSAICHSQTPREAALTLKMIINSNENS